MSKAPKELLEGIAELKKGREFISGPDKWCQGSWVRALHNGRVLDVGSDTVEAIGIINVTPHMVHKVCSAGALLVARGNNDRESMERGCAYSMLRDAVQACSETENSVEGFNDRNDHADVLALWDLAIERAEQAAKTYEHEEDTGESK